MTLVTRLWRASAALTVGLSLAGLAAPGVRAQYPDRPIRLVVPAPPGDGSDQLARSVGKAMGDALGQSLVVENKPGAGGSIASDIVAKAPPDGYTVLLGNASSHAVTPGLYSRLPYDAAKDFTAVTLLASAPNVLVINPSLPAKNIGEFIAYARAHPGKLNVGSGGNGSLSHLSAILFNSMAGADIPHVPYKGAAPAVTAVMAGEISALLINIPTVSQQIQAGKLRALAVSSLARSPQLPDVPTLDEAGLKGYNTEAWFGLFVPAQTPAPVIARLQAAAADALKSEAVLNHIKTMGAVPKALAGPAFAEFVRTEAAKYRAIIKQADVRID
ncbi:MAG: tripartite tricarboxylate transporter substrate binding protein [Pigmentiphaga sp.]|uniref:Bug family tripartite tricarboxylate transporter substrate binding protein n=1 Tax=Pigmentiphaga sp. TaxID=1977564 RepID=UPI0029AF51DF|nr:tripartite tricarboxylate transporter substrate binding protein [Pigmentiphaga sp.]MDX3907785.1 tripartite tricarboxylate transporter substrate binding protein [Pigmentiphaga sp.]